LLVELEKSVFRNVLLQLRLKTIAGQQRIVEKKKSIFGCSDPKLK
jgi:hypothetical protein